MDDFITSTLNTFAQSSDDFTAIMFLIVNNSLVKGGVVVAGLWYFWFSDKNKSPQNYEKIIITLFSSIIAIVIGRSLDNFLPYRARPILDPEFDFTYQIDKISWLNTLTSFPSDHAILFFSLATGIFLISKKWGMLSYAYVFFIICFPRIYLGFHYFTDIFAGAIIGIMITLLISGLPITKRLSKKVILFSEKFPGIFYVFFFILSYQMATLFRDSRRLISYMIDGIF
ncbi:phosphatase PAP2 family protein [Pareuzebyella sediminis]|uniref:phosphatase PAP2 family protein n=1 Tax=Pareuzebyella sediminis TaxID=2607998 RepID=UPI0011ED3A6D|nr:phosphatase PAP2 family protein [Pareuzebyella sediminis]